ncbi:proline-rich protein 12-like [Arachis ipaensis]|uniref:proline-rich protein 12-like n=1 Tax=Arachis ipaensis TaxID=130454 RepID=UPI0007AF227F|nr:proline-rich protein 12-like [Arachis ipaensis]
MNQLKEINRDCYDKLFALDPKLWTKSHFTFLAKSDMLMNNISEAFNGRILEARDKPILTMFEWIRCYLMTRFAEKKKKAERYEGSVLPKPKKRLDIIAVRAMEWQAKWAGDLKFEVNHKNRMIMERFVVVLMAGRCSSPECTQGYDAATGIGGVDAAANLPGAAVEASGSAAAPTARSRMVRGRGRGRAVVGMGRGRGRGRAAPMTAPASRPSNTPAPPSQPPHIPVPPSQPPHTPAPPSQSPHTPAPPSQPPHSPAPPSQPPQTPAPPSQPATFPTPASLPTTLPTSITAHCTSISTFAQNQNLWCEKKWKTEDWS